jgi:hypothetical protein
MEIYLLAIASRFALAQPSLLSTEYWELLPKDKAAGVWHAAPEYSEED